MKKIEKNKLLLLAFCLLYCNLLFSQENLEQIDNETYLKIKTDTIYCFGEGYGIDIEEAKELAFDNLKSNFTDVKDDAKKYVKFTIVESYGGDEVVVFCYMQKNNNNETSNLIEQHSKTVAETKTVMQNNRTETVIPIKQQEDSSTIEVNTFQNSTVENLKTLNGDYETFRKQVARIRRTDGQLYYSGYLPADPENYMMAVFQNSILYLLLDVGINSRKDLLTDKIMPTSEFNFYINNQNYKILWIQINQK